MYRVLLVEDEEIELETLRDYIDWKKNGISRVFTARNGRRAQEGYGTTVSVRIPVNE